MTKYTLLTILFTLLAGNIVSNNNQLHAQVPTPLFGEQHTLTDAINTPTSVFAADLNGDGFADVLSASAADNKIAWFPNNGAGNFGAQQIITTNADGATSVYATDIDNDGDIDVLSASASDNKIAWYANDGAGNFGIQQIITTNADNARSVYATDLDNDSDIDVLSASSYDNKIAWYANDGAGNFGSQQIISINTDGAQSVYATDLDNDGDTDVLSASAGDNKIAWYANDGAGNFGSQQIITTIANAANSVYATDIDNDGDIDVLSASPGDNKIAWYTNDGAGNFGTQQIITTNADEAIFVYAIDLDNDGDNDVLSASPWDNKIAWYANDGAGNFGEQQIITTNANWANSVYATDIDNDGDIDVLSASADDNKIATYTNNGNATFSTEQIVIQATLTLPEALCTADLDNDGFVDIIAMSSSEKKIVWFKNNGNNTFQEPNIIINTQGYIDTEINIHSLIYAADMDFDGDNDIVYSYRQSSDYGDGDDFVAWLENDGTGNFTTQHGIYSNYFISFFTLCDLNNDGSTDVFCTKMDNTINYSLNDGAGNFSIFQTIETNNSYLSDFNVVDIDNDGNKDLLFSDYAYSMAYYKNNGDGTFNTLPYLVVDSVFATNIYTTDLNNDNYTDILYTSDNNTLAWIQYNGNGTFSNPQIIATNIAISQKVIAADIDNDGDNDILIASSFSDSDVWVSANKIASYANNGNGTFAPEEIITTEVNQPNAIVTADFDNDGDLDLASTSYNDNKVSWYENLLSYLPPPTPNPPTAAFNTYPATTDTLYICQGQTVYFNNTSQNATNYSWDFGDGAQSNDSNPTHTYNTPSTNPVTLVAYNVETEQGPCPTAVDDYTQTGSGTAVTINAMDNDFTCNNNPLIFITFAPQNGTATANTNGIIIYTPNTGFVGQDIFYYELATDDGTSIASITVDVLELCTISLQNQNVVVPFTSPTIHFPIHYSNQENCFPINTACSNVFISNTDNATVSIYIDTVAAIIYVDYWANVGFSGIDCFNYYLQTCDSLYTAEFCVTVYDGPTANGKLNLTPPTPTQTASIPQKTTDNTNPNKIKGIPPLLLPNQRSDAGLTDTARIIVVVLPGTAPDISCIGTVCAGNEVSYSTNAQCSTYNWTISGADTFTGQGTPNINVTWGNDAAGSIQLSVENCTPDLCSLPLSVPIGIVPTSAHINGDSLICANQTAIYTLPYINGAQYTWSITPPSAGNITTGQYTPTVTINWLAQNATLSAHINHQLANCSVDAALGINIRPRFDILPNATLICTNDALNISTNPNVACTWDIGTGTILNGQGTDSIVATWQNAGIQTITAIATNPTQVCQTTETTTITTKNTAATPTNINGATQICPQQPYTYTAAPAIANTQFVWIVEGGTVVIGQNSIDVQVQWNNTPPYSISVYRQYSNAPVCTSDTLTLNIEPLPSDAFTITGNNSVCAGTTSTYTATSTLTNPIYNWSIEPSQAGTILQGQDTPNITVVWSTNPQNATILVGYCTQNQTLDVAINALPQVTIAQNNTLCVGSTATLSSVPQYNINTWTNSNGGIISNNTTATVSQSDTYTLTIADINGCTATSIIAVDTLPQPTALIYGAGKSTFCIQQPGQSSTLEAAVGQYFIYQWYNNGNPIAGANNPAYTHVSTADISTNNYYVVVTHSETGCTAQSNNKFIFQLDCTPDTTGGGGTGPGCPDCPPSPTCTLLASSSANFGIIADNNSCNTFTFVNNSSDNAINSIWILDNGVQFNTTDLTYTYNQIGKSRVYLLAGFNNLTPLPNECYLVAIDSVRVPIKANFNATQNVCAGDTVTFTDYSIHLIETTLTNWIYDFGDGTTATNIQNPTHIYANSGTYTVTQTVTNDTCVSAISQNITIQGIPTVSFSAAAIGCATNAVSFTPDQSNLATFQWAFGNNDSTTLAAPSYAYTTQGTYNVSLIATDVYGCANAIYTQAIDILPAPIAQNITATDTVLCAGETTTLTAPEGGTAYLWSNGSNQAQITVGTSGNYSVRVSLDNGCYYQTAPKQITVYNPPPTQINLNNNALYYCIGDTITLQAINGYIYQWSNGDTTAYTTANNTSNFNLTITDPTTTCYAVSDTVHIVFNPLPNQPIVTPSSVQLCEGETATITSPNTPNTNFLWSNNQTTNTIEVYSSGTYTVTISNSYGCIATNTASVVVTPRPNASAFPSGCYDICANDTINIPLPTNAIATWYLNDEQLSAPIVSGNNLIPIQSGNYSVVLNTLFGCTDASDTLTLEVLNNCYEPPLPVELLSFDGTIKEKGNFLRWITAAELNCNYYTLYASTNANANNIENFKPIAQLNGNGTTNTAHTYTFMHPTNEPITYYQLQQTDFDGVQKIVGNIVLMRNKAGEEIGISINPNPSHNNFNLTLLANSLPNNVQINVIDVTGRIVQQNTYATNQTITINRQNLPNGLYFVQVQNANTNEVLGVSKVIFD